MEIFKISFFNKMEHHRIGIVRNARHFLNKTLPQLWISHTGPKIWLALHFWPTRSPDLTPSDFFLWGYIKNTVFVPPLATS